eukprot:g34112.t1
MAVRRHLTCHKITFGGEAGIAYRVYDSFPPTKNPIARIAANGVYLIWPHARDVVTWCPAGLETLLPVFTTLVGYHVPGAKLASVQSWSDECHYLNLYSDWVPSLDSAKPFMPRGTVRLLFHVVHFGFHFTWNSWATSSLPT